MSDETKPKIAGKSAWYQVYVWDHLLRGYKLRAIRGYEVTIPGFERWDFFVHHSVNDIDGTEVPTDWTVTEQNACARVTGIKSSTRAAAVELAASILRLEGARKLDRACRKVKRMIRRGLCLNDLT